ncbi:hypothetical protein H0H87_002377 [Tephrocybe sp. NHM501043]|nr:hypothetical protein H0H87_002377 [Tephrocybe sp. NHM501043]
MYSTKLALALAFSFLQLALLVDAGIYVLKPEAHSTCHGGQTCTIEWLDDGIHPLLSAAGFCNFGLYTGDLKLVQAISSTDVSQTRSISFKPNPAAGPNSDSYYIGIISTTAKENSSDPLSTSYKAFSPFFTIDQMAGSFESPLPEATSMKPVPSSLTRFSTHSHSGTPTSRSTTTLSTITVGILSTSLSPLPTLTATSLAIKSPATSSVASQSKFTTSKLPSSTPNMPTQYISVASSVTSSGPPLSTSSATMGSVPPLPALAFVLSSLLASLLL